MSQESQQPEAPINAPEGPRGTPRKVWWIAGAVVLLVAAVLAWRIHGLGQKPPSPFGRGGAGGPLAVAVAKVGIADVPVMLNALGTVTPLATVSVRPQVTGPITRILFTEGQMVRAGEVLAEIDPRPYQASLDQAQAQLKRDQAQLANARIDLQRYKNLLAQQSVSEQQFATQGATVAQDEAIVAADTAAVDTAKLNLGYCRISSPLSGLAGLRQVDVGNLVQANSTATIAVVTQLRPMSVVFTVPEDTVRPILQRFRAGEKPDVDAWDRSLTNQLASGRLASIDNQIDITTGTLKLRALFDNDKSELFPNQFVNVRVLVDTQRGQVVAPAAAIQNGSTGNFVYVLQEDSTVSQRVVVIGAANGDKVAVLQGLKPGESVVVDGADQLRDGAPVRVPDATPGAAGGKGGPGGGGGRRRNGAGGPGGPGGAGGFQRPDGAGGPPGPDGQRRRRPPGGGDPAAN
jgi:multidrug efflux system membrane fusion protein